MDVAAFSFGQDASKTPQDAIFWSSDAHPSLFFLVSFCWTPFGSNFWWIFHPNLALKNKRNRSNIDANMHLILDFIFWSILLDFCPQLPPRKSEKSSPRCSESTIFEKTMFLVIIDVWSHLGANLASFWIQKSIKNPSKNQPQGIQKNDGFLHRFLNRFGSIWDAKLGACWGHVGHFFGKSDAWTQSWCGRGPFWYQRSARYPVLGATGRGGTPTWAHGADGVPVFLQVLNPV